MPGDSREFWHRSAGHYESWNTFGFDGKASLRGLDLEIFEEELDDDARCTERRVGFADRFDYSFAPAFCRPQVDKQHLIFIVFDDLAERMPTLGKIDRVELTHEDRILQMIAKVSHRLEHFAKPLVVTDVVGHQIGVSHGWGSRKMQGGPSVEMKEKRCSDCKLAEMGMQTRN